MLVGVTALFVVMSQLKTNVTDAYAGSLAWSNFFSRLTHNQPGRVVWLVFNTVNAFMLMELNVFKALGDVLGLYSNIAIAGIMAVVADLVFNKPPGLSPPGIEFRRAHLYEINPAPWRWLRCCRSRRTRGCTAQWSAAPCLTLSGQRAESLFAADGGYRAAAGEPVRLALSSGNQRAGWLGVV